MEWSLDGLLSELYPLDLEVHPRWLPSADIVLTQDPMGKTMKNLLHLKLFGQLGPKFDEMVFWMVPFENCIQLDPRFIQDGHHSRT